MTPLEQAAVDHVWQQEQWAHAEFYHGKLDYDRKAVTAPGEYPWRGIMSPTILSLIAQLESEGLYSGGDVLNEPRAKNPNPSPYRHSPYDYAIARRVEAEKAEQKWLDLAGKNE